MGVPSGWIDDGLHLTAPNGNSVVLAFRRHILTHEWASDDWPVESAHYEQFLDITNPLIGDGLVQFFRKSILARQQDSNRVLELWSGAIALEWQRRIDSKGEMTRASVYRNPFADSLPPANLLAESATPSAERLASLEKQVHMLISGLGSGARPNDVARTIQDYEDMIAPLGKASGRSYRPLSNPRFLIRWIAILIALLCSDSVAWAISNLIHRPTLLSLPLLALGTAALSAVFFFLLSLRPRPAP